MKNPFLAVFRFTGLYRKQETKFLTKNSYRELPAFALRATPDGQRISRIGFKQTETRSSAESGQVGTHPCFLSLLANGAEGTRATGANRQVEWSLWEKRQRR